MTKKELIKESASAIGMSVADVAMAADAMFSIIKKEVSDGGQVQLHGFGTFGKRTIAGHKARNPKTGAEIMVPEKERVFFRAVGSFLAGKQAAE